MGFPHAIKAENYPAGLAILRLKHSCLIRCDNISLKNINSENSVNCVTTTSTWTVRSSVTTLSVSPTSCCDNICQTTASVRTNRCGNMKKYAEFENQTSSEPSKSTDDKTSSVLSWFYPMQPISHLI